MRSPKIMRRAPSRDRRTFVVAIALGLTVAAIAFALPLGVRPDVAFAGLTWRFDFKLAMTITLAITSGWLVWRLSRPALDPRPAELALVIAPLALVGAVAYELWSVPQTEWLPRAIGSNSVACLLSISSLSLAPLGGALYALRRGAPLSPGFAGAAAGLLASALAAMLYALHCPDDSPLFGTIWYTAVIALVIAAGAIRWAKSFTGKAKMSGNSANHRHQTNP
jgi:hypothetical protein